MKKIQIIIALAASCLIGSAFADDASMSATAAAPANNAAKPCKSIFEACKAAGFSKGDKQGKGIMKDCVGKIIKGETVPGVTVDSSLIPACQEMVKAKHANMKAKKESQSMPATAAPTSESPSTTPAAQ